MSHTYHLATHSLATLALLTLAIGCNNRTADQAVTTVQPTPAADQEAGGKDAVCQLISIGDSGVTGTVRFIREGGSIHVLGEVAGLSPGLHGFHVHESGDLSDKETGKSAGGHFNPTEEEHGKPSDSKRHVGDLGNIEANAEGKATIDMINTVITLNGPNSIIGKGLVVHAKPDNFTQPSGDAGDRVAFGVIEVASP